MPFNAAFERAVVRDFRRCVCRATGNCVRKIHLSRRRCPEGLDRRDPANATILIYSGREAQRRLSPPPFLPRRADQARPAHPPPFFRGKRRVAYSVIYGFSRHNSSPFRGFLRISIPIFSITQPFLLKTPIRNLFLRAICGYLFSGNICRLSGAISDHVMAACAVPARKPLPASLFPNTRGQ